MLADVLHCFAKHAIVHELKKVLFKPILALSAHLHVQINVLFQPWLLLELEDSMDLGEFHPQIKVQLQISMMENILLLVVKIGY